MNAVWLWLKGILLERTFDISAMAYQLDSYGSV
jgi:hypothetical protein